MGPDSPVIDSDARIDVDALVIDHDRDMKDIVDGLLNSPLSASLGRFPTSRLMRQVMPKLVVDDLNGLDTGDVINDGFTRVGRRGDESELTPGLLGAGKRSRLKGGVTMDSGCLVDTMPAGHVPGIAVCPY